jgi:hypothetical protein
MAMLAMAILVLVHGPLSIFQWYMVYRATAPRCAIYTQPNCGQALQPRHLAHARPASSLAWTVHGAP